jgi:hypothetical protein
VILFLLFLASCADRPEADKWLISPGGLRYVIHSGTGDTTHPRPGLVCEIDIRYGTPDTVFLDTWKQGRPAHINMRGSQYPGDLFEGMGLVSKGDSVTFRVLADSFFIRTTGLSALPPSVEPGDSVDILMTIRDIMTSREHRIRMAREIHQNLGNNPRSDTVK